MEASIYFSEFACYYGAYLSAKIAWRLHNIENLTFFNKFFLIYFLFDSTLGFVETYFLFKLYRDR